MVSVNVYWGGIEGKYPAGQSDPNFFGSWACAEKSARGIAKANAGTIDKVELTSDEMRVYGTTPFGPFEAVVRRIV